MEKDTRTHEDRILGVWKGDEAVAVVVVVVVRRRRRRGGCVAVCRFRSNTTYISGASV